MDFESKIDLKTHNRKTYKHTFWTDRAVEALKKDSMALTIKIHGFDRKRVKSWKEMRLSIPKSIRNIKQTNF